MSEMLKLEKKKVHSLFILRDFGTCIYSRNFTGKFDNIDIDLVTNFFGALFSFVEEVTSERMENLEMLNVRLVFRSTKDFLENQEENLIFCLMADIGENSIFLRNSLFMIMMQFYNMYEDLLPDRVKGTPKLVREARKDYIVIKNNDLDTVIDSIISGEWEIDSYKGYYEEVEDYLDDLIHENEILGAALLSITGNIINSSLSSKILSHALKELEIRLQTGYLDPPLMIYVLEDGCKVFTKEIVNNEYLILHYESSIPLGMCNVTSSKIANHIAKLYQDWS
ncbi:MAG: hypothetical protein ACXAC5_21530 [Promethearchaeota archaeon]|jgi:hypothetical protein